MKNLITSWIDIINTVPQYFNANTGILLNTTKGDIFSIIQEEESIVRSLLAPCYGTTLDGNSLIKTKCISINKYPDFQFLLNSINFSITNKSTQNYRIEFTGLTTFEITSDYDGIFTGNTLNNCVMTDITIKKEAWGNYNFNPGDILFLTTYYYDPTLISIVTKLASAKLLETSYITGNPGSSPHAEILRKQGQGLINKLIDDTNGQMLSISRVSRGSNYQAVDYSIDSYGNDITEYSN
jgi:hypothetical protein